MENKQIKEAIGSAIMADFCHSASDLGTLVQGKKEVEARWGTSLQEEGTLRYLLGLVFNWDEELSHLDYLKRFLSLGGKFFVSDYNLEDAVYQVTLGAYVKETAIENGLLRKEQLDDVLMLYL